MTHVIVWRFGVEPAKVAEFERAYGPAGDWVQLFRKSHEYIESELLRETPDDASGRDRVYFTIDRWQTRDAYEAFRENLAGPYAELDARCLKLTTVEKCLGKFDLVEG